MNKLDFGMLPQIPAFLREDSQGYALAKAIEAGIRDLAANVEQIDTLLCDIDKMPLWALDRLALEWGVPWYDFTGNEARRRAWLKNAQRIIRMAGTKTAIEELLLGIFADCRVEEYWQYGGEVYHFRAVVMGLKDRNVGGVASAVRPITGVAVCGSGYMLSHTSISSFNLGDVDKTLLDWAQRATDTIKPLRCVLDNIVMGHRERIQLSGQINSAQWQMRGEWHTAETEVMLVEEGRIIEVDFTIDATAIPVGGEVKAIRLLNEQGNIILEKQVIIRLAPNRLKVPYRVVIDVEADD